MDAEVIMRYAWLEFHRGIWLLLTDDKSEPVEAAQRWIDEGMALSELSAEGWMISGPFPKRREVAFDSSRKFYGLALTRTIH
jgi:hypothetical protein